MTPLLRHSVLLGIAVVTTQDRGNRYGEWPLWAGTEGLPLRHLRLFDGR